MGTFLAIVAESKSISAASPAFINSCHQTQTIEMAFALDTLKGRRNWALATVGSVGGLIFAIKARKGVQAEQFKPQVSAEEAAAPPFPNIRSTQSLAASRPPPPDSLLARPLPALLSSMTSTVVSM